MKLCHFQEYRRNWGQYVQLNNPQFRRQILYVFSDPKSRFINTNKKIKDINLSSECFMGEVGE
jgi:hypothetical protein